MAQEERVNLTLKTKLAFAQLTLVPFPKEVRKINYEEMLKEDMIGQGSFASIYAAKYRGQRVVYKQMREGNYDEEETISRIKLFYNEMKLLQLMNHGNIVRFVGGVESPVGAVLEYMAFDFSLDISIASVRVNSLYGVLSHIEKYREFHKYERDYNLPMTAACHTACGLSYMHNCKIAHMDLKPLNILASNRHGIIVFKITDFGEARSNLIHTCTSISADRGTLVCNGPELTLFDSVLDLEELIMHDVWLYGILLFLIWNADVSTPWHFELCGRHYISRSIIKRCMGRKELPLSSQKYHMPVEINTLYRRCCHYEPSDRPTMQQVEAILMASPQAVAKPMRSRTAASATLTRADVDIELVPPPIPPMVHSINMTAGDRLTICLPANILAIHEPPTNLARPQARFSMAEERAHLQIPAKSKPAHPTLVEETPHTNEYSLHPEDEPQLPKLLYLDEILGTQLSWKGGLENILTAPTLIEMETGSSEHRTSPTMSPSLQDWLDDWQDNETKSPVLCSYVVERPKSKLMPLFDPERTSTAPERTSIAREPEPSTDSSYGPKSKLMPLFNPECISTAAERTSIAREPEPSTDSSYENEELVGLPDITVTTTTTTTTTNTTTTTTTRRTVSSIPCSINITPFGISGLRAFTQPTVQSQTISSTFRGRRDTEDLEVASGQIHTVRKRRDIADLQVASGGTKEKVLFQNAKGLAPLQIINICVKEQFDKSKLCLDIPTPQPDAVFVVDINCVLHLHGQHSRDPRTKYDTSNTEKNYYQLVEAGGIEKVQPEFAALDVYMVKKRYSRKEVKGGRLNRRIIWTVSQGGELLPYAVIQYNGYLDSDCLTPRPHYVKLC